MAEEKYLTQAKSVYTTLCNALDYNNWKYERHDEKLTIISGSLGEDLPIAFAVTVNADVGVVTLVSRLPLTVPKDKQVETAAAVAIANRGLAHGNFDYDLKEGHIFYRMSNSFRGCALGEGSMVYMISVGCQLVDNYNDRFLMLTKGMINLQQFAASENR